MRRKWIFMIPIGIAAITLFVFIGGTAVQLLWNWLLPPLFGWKELTFWQALGMLALCRILFGGHGFRGGSRSSLRRRMAERWEQMTPEEREQARQRWQGRCGVAPPEPPDARPSD